MFGDLRLFLLTAFAEGALFEAQGGDSVPQAAQGKIAVAFNLQGLSLIFTLHGNRDVHAGGVPLQADHERVWRRYIPGQADIGGDITVRLAGKNDLLDPAERMFTHPQLANRQGRSLPGEAADELLQPTAEASLPLGHIPAGICQAGLDLLHQVLVIF
jgi:hypothetical protein